MISLLDYITEALEKSTRDEVEKRLEEISSDLKKSNKYEDYVEKLNKILEDPKAAAILKYGFGGDMGDMSFRFSKKNIKASKLIPTQKEIDVNKSLDNGLKAKWGSPASYFREPVELLIPLITFNGKYIIDGHHRWSQAFTFNPGASMVCYDFINPRVKPLEMLKAVQSAIAAVKGDPENNNNGTLPSNKVEGQNILDSRWDENAIRSYISENMSELCEDQIRACAHINSRDEIIDYLVENCMLMKKSNRPVSGAPARGEMPQTDKGGEDPNNISTALPDANGSSLNKLATGQFIDAFTK